jgi:hypothetical protein
MASFTVSCDRRVTILAINRPCENKPQRLRGCAGAHQGNNDNSKSRRALIATQKLLLSANFGRYRHPR